MKTKTIGRLALAAMIAGFGAMDAAAQQGRRGGEMGPGMRGGPDGAAGPGIERIIRMQEELGLDDSQLEALDEIRRQSISQRTGVQTRMTELRSELEAGLIRRSDLMAAMEDFREAGQAISEQHRERIQEILTDEQVAKLDASRQGQGRRGGMRRGGADRDRGGKGMRGQRPGRGAEFSPAVRSQRDFQRGATRQRAARRYQPAI